MVIDNNKNRLCIYFFYDSEGIVDDYVFYMLDDLNKSCKEIAFVSNGQLTNFSRERLKSTVTCVFERDNKGFDVWAYKHVIDCYGWDKLLEFDEIIMANFTIVGPVYPLSNMFDEMSKKDLDFWGITLYYGAKYNKHGIFDNDYMPTHLQSHFITVRKSMVKSKSFQDYWDNMGEINNYDDAVCKHEAIFTDYFEKQGFKWEAYVDSDDFKSITSNPLMFLPDKMIKQKKCPIFKRKIFFLSMEILSDFTYGELLRDLISTLLEKNYDIKPILKNIVRTSKNMDMRSALNTLEIVSSKATLDKKMDISSHDVIAVRINNIEYFELLLPYLKNIIQNIDIRLFVTNTKIKDYVKSKVGSIANLKICFFQDGVSWIKTLIDFSKKYDNIICISFIDPIYLEGGILRRISYNKFQLESLIGNAKQFENTLNLISHDSEFKGLYFPIPANFGRYKIYEKEVWSNIFKTSYNIAKSLGIKSKITADDNVFGPKGGNFIVKSQVLRSIDYNKISTDIVKKSDFEMAFFNLLPLLAQQNGVISSYILSDNIAESYCNISLFNEYKKDVRVEPEFINLNVYFDTGNGFNESDKILKTIALSEFKNVVFNFNLPKNTKFVRFDPIEGHGFRCENLTFKLGEKNISVFSTNCVRFGNVDFCSFVDPHYIIEILEPNCSNIIIKMDNIQIFAGIDLEQESSGVWANTLGAFGQQRVYYEKLISVDKQEISRLNSVNSQLNNTLNDIYNSRSYKLMRAFLNIKDNFKAKN